MDKLWLVEKRYRGYHAGSSHFYLVSAETKDKAEEALKDPCDSSSTSVSAEEINLDSGPLLLYEDDL